MKIVRRGQSTLLALDQLTELTPICKGGSQSCGDEFEGFPRISVSHLLLPLNLLLVHSQSHCFKSWVGRHHCLLPVLPFWLFHYPGVGTEPGGIDWGNGVPASFNPARKRKCQKSCSPSYFRDTGLGIWKQQPPCPCHLSSVWFSKGTMIHNVAQLLIWFITESQIGTFKVMVNRQLAPGR